MKPSELAKLTEYQQEMADVLVEACNLGTYSETVMVFMGEPGTVHYGLGRCVKHLLRINPDLMESTEAIGKVRDMVMKSLGEQGLLGTQ